MTKRVSLVPLSIRWSLRPQIQELGRVELLAAWNCWPRGTPGRTAEFRPKLSHSPVVGVF